MAQGYTPFGQPLWSEGSGSTGYGFTGERWEAYAQLLFLRARYYEPGTGRFLSKDTWLGDLQQPSSLHGWIYVRHNPLRYQDPSGQFYIDPEEGVIISNGIPWPEAPPNATTGQFTLISVLVGSEEKLVKVMLPAHDPTVSLRRNTNGTFTVYSVGNPPFIYPTDVQRAARMLRCEAMGAYARTTDMEKRETHSAAIVWVARNRVERGTCWKGRALTPQNACQSLMDPSKICNTCKTQHARYPWYAFCSGSKSYSEDELVALRVFLGQIPDPTGGAVYMINEQCYQSRSEEIQYLETVSGGITWKAGQEDGTSKWGHHFYWFDTGKCP